LNKLKTRFLKQKTDCGTNMEIVYCILYLAIIGFISNFVGDRIDRKKIFIKSFPFSAFKFEKDGLFYEKFRIRKWKDILPDMSKIRPSMVKKKVKQYRSIEEKTALIEETCVAEIVHVVLIPLGIPCFTIGGWLWGGISFAVWTLGNIPFIMIQRYNRVRLFILLERLKKKEEKD
jgi:glycosyl-4,4'-diaponeurosporenoate acyltransferase